MRSHSMRVTDPYARDWAEKLDALLTAAEGVGGRMDGASRLVTKTVTNPVVKALAIGTGTKEAVRRIRTGERRPVERRRAAGDGRG